MGRIERSNNPLNATEQIQIRYRNGRFPRRNFLSPLAFLAPRALSVSEGMPIDEKLRSELIKLNEGSRLPTFEEWAKNEGLSIKK